MVSCTVPGALAEVVEEGLHNVWLARVTVKRGVQRGQEARDGHEVQQEVQNHLQLLNGVTPWGVWSSLGRLLTKATLNLILP